MWPVCYSKHFSSVFYSLLHCRMSVLKHSGPRIATTMHGSHRVIQGPLRGLCMNQAFSLQCTIICPTDPSGTFQAVRRRPRPRPPLPDRIEPVALPPHVAEFVMEVPITPEMSPKPRLLVYYVREDGETVADSVDLDVTKCLDNQVLLIFQFVITMWLHDTSCRASKSVALVCRPCVHTQAHTQQLEN